MVTGYRADFALDDLRRDYGALRPLYKSFTDRVRTLIADLLRQYGVRVQSVEARAKSVSGLLEKVQRADKMYRDPLREVTDLSGVRIIAYYNRDVETIGQILSREFRVDCEHSIDKAQSLGADQFGYQSIHYILQVPSSRVALTEWHAFRDLKVEVQIRTVLQHAWAAINHSLTYKVQADVPRLLRRRLNRISALLEAADAEFDDLHDALAVTPPGAAGPGADSGPLRTGTAIDALSLQGYLDTRGVEAHWETMVEQADFAPLPAIDGGAAARSNLLAFLGLAGIITIDELDRRLHAVMPSAPMLFRAIRAVWESTAPGRVPAANPCAAMRIALLFTWPPRDGLALLQQAPFGGDMHGIVAELLQTGKFVAPPALAA